MPSTQPEQAPNLHYAVEGPLPERMPTNELTGAIAEVHMTLAAISHHSFSICNNLPPCQAALIQLNQQHSTFNQAYLGEVQKNRDIIKTNEALRTQLDDMNSQVFKLRSFNASLERKCYETQMASNNMKLLIEDLRQDNNSFSQEQRKTGAEYQQVLAGTAAQAAELALQQHNAGTLNEVPRTSDVEGVVRPAAVVHGGVRVVKNSDSNNLGFENTQLTSTGAGSDQAQTSGGSDHKKGRSRRRQGNTDINQLTLQVT